MDLEPVAAAFVEGLGRAPGEGSEGWEEALGRAIAAGRAEHPGIALDAARFARWLGEKAGMAQSARAALQALHIGDLYLIRACLDGDRRAVEVLDRTVLAKAARAALRLDATDAFVEEVHQRLRERLLMAEKGVPRLAEYAGTGPLVAWCKVAAMRIALNLKAVPARDVPLEPEAVGAAPDVTGVESAAIREHHAEDLRAAFAKAAAGLTHEERVLLRYHFVDGLNFEQIAPLFQTHRSTISRRVAAAREKLLEGTQGALRERLGASTSEIDSLLRVAHSRLDLDLTAWLKTQG